MGQWGGSKAPLILYLSTHALTAILSSKISSLSIYERPNINVNMVVKTKIATSWPEITL
jgi:hypothetical protein